jgi:hypothetical protein
MRPADSGAYRRQMAIERRHDGECSGKRWP